MEDSGGQLGSPGHRSQQPLDRQTDVCLSVCECVPALHLLEFEPLVSEILINCGCYGL